MIDADAQLRTAPQGRNHGVRELKSQEMNGRSLLVVLALEIFVCNGKNPFLASDLHPAASLDPLQLRELA